MALTRQADTAGQRAFTLVELLAATALFAVLGTMLFQMVQGGMELSARGERVRDLEEQALAVMDLMAEDLRHAWCGVGGAGEQTARFVLENQPFGSPDHGPLLGQTALLRFSRLLHEQRSLAWLRNAGERPGAERAATLSGREDPRELLPTGGLAESLYTCAQVPDEDLPVLMRLSRSPLGGAGSLLAAEVADLERRLLWDGVRLVERVLHFSVRCWAPDTVAWQVAAESEGASASAAWDSTRGLEALGETGLPHELAYDSLLDGRDDLFPPAVRIELVLDPYSDSQLAEAQLAEDLDSESTRLSLSSGRLGGDERAPPFVWIDGEWLAVQRRVGGELIVERGQRGTVPSAHRRGSAVRVGQLFERVVLLPSARENFDR